MKYFVLALVLALTCLATSAMAYNLYTEVYEMTNDATTAAGTLHGYTMNLTGAAAPSGGQGNSYSDGIMTFTDTSGSGNYGISLNGANFSAVVGTGGYIADTRIAWVSGCDGGGNRASLGFSGSSGNGRGMRINETEIRFWGNGDKGGVSGLPGGGGWWNLRIVVAANGFTQLYGNNGDGTYTHLGDSDTTPGSTGLPNGTSIALGDYSGGTTTNTVWKMDYLYIGQGTDVNMQFVKEAPTPEPGSLLALGSGLLGFAGFAIRRRRA